MHLISKKELRKLQIKKLTELASSKQKLSEDKILKEKLLRSSLLTKAESIGISTSTPIEVNTAPIIASLWKMRRRIYIPCCLPRRKMESTLYDRNAILVKTKFGILENHDSKAIVNDNLDLIIVLGLAYGLDRNSRFGFGGGYYDRFLERYPTQMLSLTNSAQFSKQTTWRVEEYDIPIEKLILVK